MDATAARELADGPMPAVRLAVFEALAMLGWDQLTRLRAVQSLVGADSRELPFIVHDNRYASCADDRLWDSVEGRIIDMMPAPPCVSVVFHLRETVLRLRSSDDDYRRFHDERADGRPDADPDRPV